MKILQSIILLLVVSAAGLAQRPSQGQGPMPGDIAPDFTLNTKDGSGSVTLSEQLGRPTALIFASYT